MTDSLTRASELVAIADDNLSDHAPVDRLIQLAIAHALLVIAEGQAPRGTVYQMSAPPHVTGNVWGAAS